MLAATSAFAAPAAIAGPAINQFEIKDLEVLLHSIATRCRELFGHGSEVAIMLLDRDTEELYFPYTDTQRPLHMPQLSEVRIPAGPGTLSGAVMASGKSELVPDAEADIV